MKFVWIRRLVVMATLLYFLLLFTATHLPPRDMPNTHVNDKIEHFTAYFLLCVLLQVCVGLFRRRLIWVATIWFCVMCWGAVDEISQPPFGRDCDIHDWYADSAGATAASLIAAGALAVMKSPAGSGLVA